MTGLQHRLDNSRHRYNPTPAPVPEPLQPAVRAGAAHSEPNEGSGCHRCLETSQARAQRGFEPATDGLEGRRTPSTDVNRSVCSNLWG
jgi:hypothetical protein